MEVDDVLEHYGIKGMHWGIRNPGHYGRRRTLRIQKRLDRIDRVSRGTATKKDRLLAANNYIFTKKGSKRVLKRGAKLQNKVNDGHAFTRNFLLTMQGIRIKDLDFHQKT